MGKVSIIINKLVYKADASFRCCATSSPNKRSWILARVWRDPPIQTSRDARSLCMARTVSSRGRCSISRVAREAQSRSSTRGAFDHCTAKWRMRTRGWSSNNNTLFPSKARYQSSQLADANRARTGCSHSYVALVIDGFSWGTIDRGF